MSRRADAHIHLFRHGYERTEPQTPDELTRYAAMAQQHNIAAALVVGYEGEPWAAHNNAYLAEIGPRHEWVRPVAFVHHIDRLTTNDLDALHRQGFVGISLYLFGDEALRRLGAASADVWRWLIERRWLISVNAKGAAWSTWRAVLDQHPELRVLVAHLGLPPARSPSDEPTDAAAAIAPVTALAAYPQVRVKLSGFYALTEPGHDYPHRAAWPYVEHLLATFGPRRLLWGSDFTPCLQQVSFPQALGVLARVPCLTADHRRLIEGENLLALLNETD